MFSRALDKAIPNYIMSSATPLAYKAIQNFTTDNDGWTIMEHLLIHNAPYCGGNADDPQNKIYYLNIIPREYLYPFINRCALLHKNILIVNQDVYLDLIFDQVLPQLMNFQGFPFFLSPSMLSFFSSRGLTVALLHTTMKPFSTCMNI